MEKLQIRVVKALFVPVRQLWKACLSRSQSSLYGSAPSTAGGRLLSPTGPRRVSESTLVTSPRPESAEKLLNLAGFPL